MVLPERLEAEAEFMRDLRDQGLTGEELREEAMGTRAEYEERQHGYLAITPLAVPPLATCASPGRAWRLYAARHSQSEAQPLGARPRPPLLERAAFKSGPFHCV